MFGASERPNREDFNYNKKSFLEKEIKRLIKNYKQDIDELENDYDYDDEIQSEIDSLERVVGDLKKILKENKNK